MPSFPSQLHSSSHDYELSPHSTRRSQVNVSFTPWKFEQQNSKKESRIQSCKHHGLQGKFAVILWGFLSLSTLGSSMICRRTWHHQVGTRFFGTGDVTKRVEFGAAVDLELRPSDENVVNIRKRHVNISRLKTHQLVIQVFFVDFLKGLQFHSFLWSRRSTVQLVFWMFVPQHFMKCLFESALRGLKKQSGNKKKCQKQEKKATSHHSISFFLCRTCLLSWNVLMLRCWE